MADERAVYPDSSRRSEQLSCIKYFHPSYGLFYMNFQSFNDILKLLLIRKMLCAPSIGYTQVYPGDDKWAKGDPVDQSRFD